MGLLISVKVDWLPKVFLQTLAMDYSETFSQVIKLVTVRLVFSLALSHAWLIKQLDVSNSFLNGDLSEVVYMAQLEGFVNPSFPTHVCKLHKALYGLKQAPRAWNDKLQITLLKWGFINAKADTSLFISSRGDSLLLLLVYVDAILVIGPNQLLISKLISNLNDVLALTDLGDVHYFLGIEVHRTTIALHLTQSKYITDLLFKTNMDGSKPSKSPARVLPKLALVDSAPFEDISLYWSTIGALQYLTLTRSDVDFIINHLIQFMHAPTLFRW